MGTHPIFESDFDCLTELFMSRILLRAMPRIRQIRLQSNLNNNNTKLAEVSNAQPQIHLTNKEIFSEQPLGVLNSKDFTLIVLHGALQSKDLLVKDNFERLWTQSIYRVAVDGALNDLYQLERESPSIFIPHTVCGDFDSLNDYVFDEYKHYGIEVVETPDQNSTDFSKALKLVTDRISDGMLPADKPIVAMASTKMDRADHQLAFYHSLYKTALETITPVYLIQDSSLIRVLKKGFHQIRTDTGFEEGTFGLFPLDGATDVVTTGLKWNINGTLRFGETVSSSNQIEESEVEITTSGPLILTMKIGRPESKCCGGGCS